MAALYESKLFIAKRHLAQFVADHPDLKLPVTFDSWYTQPGFCRYVDKTLQLPYIGTLTGKKDLKSFAGQLKQEHLTALKTGRSPLFRQVTIPYKGDKETYYCYCRTLHIHNFGKQRLVISHSKADLSDKPRFFNSNRLFWQASGMTRIRRHRWPVEVYHQEGKAEGLDQYQGRDFQAISRHIGLVAVTYSLRRIAPHDLALKHKLQRHLKVNLDHSAPAWPRATCAQSLWSFGSLITAGLAQGQSLDEILSPLLTAVYA